MSEFIKIDDTVRFGIVIHDPSGNFLINTDETPRWYVFKNDSDTPVLTGNFTERTGYVGRYRSSFAATLANGFASGDYIEIHASGKVSGIMGGAITKTAVINDVFDANLRQVNGTNVQLYDLVQADVIKISGVPVTIADIMEADLTSISGVSIADSTYITNKVWNEQMTNSTHGTYGSGMKKITDDIFYAAIKFIKDTPNSQDEYIVQWFRNDKPMPSGSVTNPALSVYRTTASTSLIQNAVLVYNSVNNGALRYNESTNLATSGEPYLATTSGLIDGVTRVWSNPVGLDYLS